VLTRVTTTDVSTLQAVATPVLPLLTMNSVTTLTSHNTAGRLHSSASTALKLGLLDPEQGGVDAMLAARAASTCDTQWGELIQEPGYIADERLNADAAASFTALGNLHLVTLVHVPVCTLTIKIIHAATSGWSPARHWLHHPTVRTAVHTVLLVAERLHGQARLEVESADADVTATAAAVASSAASGAAVVAAVSAAAVDGVAAPATKKPSNHATATAPTTEPFPEIPPELWLVIMRFFLRSDWIHPAALKQRPDILTRHFPPGLRVELVGLKDAAWNGKQGKVMPGDDNKAAMGRVVVLVDGDERARHLMYSNLVRQFPAGEGCGV
jgi:hypothetical protein